MSDTRASAGSGPAAERPVQIGEKYDLELLMQIAAEEAAYDESSRVRVTQDDIRKLVEKKRKTPRA